MNEWTLNSRIIFVAFIDMFSLHSNDISSWQSSSAEKISLNVVPFFYHHSVVIQNLVSDRILSLISKENVHNVIIWNRHCLKSSRNRYQSWLLGNFRYTRRSENDRVVTIGSDALRYLSCLFRKFSRVLEKR